MRTELDREQDRSTVLARFVSDLSADDERLLRELLGDSTAYQGASGAGDGTACQDATDGTGDATDGTDDGGQSVGGAR